MSNYLLSQFSFRLDLSQGKAYTLSSATKNTVNKLDKNVQDKIKDKKANDIFKVKVENIGWQIIYIEDFKPAKKATFEESKKLLTNLAKQQLMVKEIDNLLKR